MWRNLLYNGSVTLQIPFCDLFLFFIQFYDSMKQNVYEIPFFLKLFIHNDNCWTKENYRMPIADPVASQRYRSLGLYPPSENKIWICVLANMVCIAEGKKRWNYSGGNRWGFKRTKSEFKPYRLVFRKMKLKLSYLWPVRCIIGFNLYCTLANTTAPCIK